ncbi:MAG: hypothetical protein AB7G48_00375 [Nitrospiraceae bacterium]
MGSQARFLAGALCSLGLLVSACSTMPREEASVMMDYGVRTSIYTSLDSTALVYTNPAAGSPADDNPWRWAGFVMHPIGVGLDYLVNRPLYSISSSIPRASGYTNEDAMLDAYRQR